MVDLQCVVSFSCTKVLFLTTHRKLCEIDLIYVAKYTFLRCVVCKCHPLITELTKVSKFQIVFYVYLWHMYITHKPTQVVNDCSGSRQNGSTGCSVWKKLWWMLMSGQLWTVWKVTYMYLVCARVCGPEVSIVCKSFEKPVPGFALFLYSQYNRILICM